MLRFLNSTPARVVTLLLVLQGALLYSSIRPEYVPQGRPLAEFPRQLQNWSFVQEGVVEPEILEVLQADDLLNRTYHEGPIGASLFVAAFRSQRTGKAPHSPKNCLPGSGWLPLADRKVTVDVGQAQPIVVNRYIIAKGEERSLVMYWYQSRDRVVASEYEAKFWVMADAMRYNRTDTALVRIVIPINEARNLDEARADKAAMDFVRSFYPLLRDYLPA
jgi:EpsI family protein